MTPSPTAWLLQDGRRVSDPSAEQRALLAGLEAHGLVQASWSRTFACVRLDDDDLLAGAPDRSCTEHLVFRGLGEPLRCEGCGREHWLEDERGLLDSVRLHLVPNGVAAFLERQLESEGLRARPMRDAVAWRVELQADDIYLCLLDHSIDSRYASHAFTATNAVVYVVVDWRIFHARFADSPARVVPLYRLVDDPDVLVRELGAAIVPASGPCFVAEPAPAWSVLRPLEPRVVRHRLGARVLEVQPRSALLDGAEVLGSRAAGLLPVLRFLVERWREDLADGKHPDDHCAFTVDEIRDGLRDSAGDAPSLGTVRKQLTRLRERIPSNYRARTGLPLADDAVVEHVEGLGYRLCATGLLARVVGDT